MDSLYLILHIENPLVGVIGFAPSRHTITLPPEGAELADQWRQLERGPDAVISGVLADLDDHIKQKVREKFPELDRE